MVLCGIDQIEQYPDYFSGRLGFITSSSSVNGRLRSGIELLHERYGLSALFAPEHGVRGNKAAGEMVDAALDEATGVPVYSLYRKDSKHLTDDMLEKVDTLVYDIQDVGVRYYTYISTLRYALEDCARAGKRLVVLDRPNPLGGAAAEGGLLRNACRSFVGCAPIPVRYGLTVGELAAFLNSVEGLGCDLKVVPCAGWNRRELFPHTGLVWMPPSPNIPRFETALLYPGTCLIEGTNLSEGRGTASPFEQIGAPFLCAQELTDTFNARGLPGLIATPAYFTPTASKYAGQACEGIYLHITSPEAVCPVRVGVELLDMVRKLAPGEFRFLEPTREGGRPFISLLAGCSDFEAPDWDKEAILNRFAAEEKAFTVNKQRWHLYR